MTIDRDIIIACNAGNELDARYFLFEEEAYEHFCDYGDDYIYTALNQAEGWSRPMNEEFTERLYEARASSRFEREEARGERIAEMRREMA